MTLPEVAERTRRSLRVLQRWAKAGDIPVTKVGRVYFVNEEDLPAIEAMPRPGRPRKPK